MAWGSSSLRSCSSLWEKIERNELNELCILPIKKVTSDDWQRLCSALSLHGSDRRLVSIQASSHTIDLDSLKLFSDILNETSRKVAWQQIAVGDGTMDDAAIQALVSAWDKDCRIQNLDLSYKKYTGKGLKNILKWAGVSTHLVEINLSRNSKLVEGFTSAQLLSMEDVAFTSLRDVNVADCNIVGDSGAELVSLLVSIPNLRSLQLSRNSLDASAVDSLGRLSAELCELSLSNCSLSNDDLRNIVPKLSTLKDLKMLDLSQNEFTATSELATGLANAFPSLQSLNLSGNNLQDNGVATLIQRGLYEREDSFGILDLSSTNCGADAAFLAIDSSRARELRLFGNSLGSEGFRRLGSCLQGGHRSTKSLDLGGNGADEDAVVTLLKGLLDTKARNESVLTTIVVGGNQGGPKLEQLVVEIKKGRSIDIARDRLQNQKS